MINIALDTSGIGKNRSQNHASYKALKRLITADQIKIYIPYVVKREIETQQLAYYLTDYKNLLCTRQISQNPYPIRVLPS